MTGCSAYASVYDMLIASPLPIPYLLKQLLLICICLDENTRWFRTDTIADFVYALTHHFDFDFSMLWYG